MQGDPPGPLQAHNPFHLAELLADSPDAGALLAKLAQPRPGPAA